MSKTLVVSYLPNAHSVTKKALDHFLAQSQGKTTVVHRDLVKHNPPVFNETSMTAYQLRGFMGKALEGDHAEAIKPFDVLIDEFAAADTVVFAFPMHNWSEPGVVKTYIDAILQAGKTIIYGDKGPQGVFKDHKAVVIYASGGQYDETNPRGTIKPAFTYYLNAIGITDVTFIPVGGTLMGPEVTEKNLNSAKAEVETVAKKWFAGKSA